VALTLPPFLRTEQTSVVDTSTGMTIRLKAGLFYYCCLGTIQLLM
jgi:hypothetical protein